MQTQQVLSALRGAVRELSSTSQPGTPSGAAAAGATGGGGAAGAAAALASGGGGHEGPSGSHLLLQISALHKAFLALSEAFLEELHQRQVEQEEQRGALESVRRECGGKLQVAAALQQDVQQLAAVYGQQAHSQAVLTQRCVQLEQEVARLKDELDCRRAEEAATILQQVQEAVAGQLAAAQQQWQEQQLPALLAAAADQAMQRWSARALPPLLQQRVGPAAEAAVQQQLHAVHEAVQGTAELAASMAADLAALAADVGQLSDWCSQIDAAHHNHEQRLGRMEESSFAAGGTAAADEAAPAAAAAAAAPLLAQLQQQMQSLQVGQVQLDEAMQQFRQQQEQSGAGWQHQLQQDAVQQEQQSQQQQLQQQLQDVLGDLGSLSLAAAELPAVQQQLGAVADQQAQQARTTEELVHSVLTDVMALARHTKVLDKELRSLRKEAQQTQQALLASCSVFSRVLAIPSPIGPFTSLPPQL